MEPSVAGLPYHLAMSRHAPARAAMLVGLLAAVGACTPPPSTELAVRNDSDETFYVRLEGAGSRKPLTYRVDAGVGGLAVAPGDVPATRLIVYSAGCDVLTEESDPQLGSMDVDRAGNLSFNVGMSRGESFWPELPTDDTCG
jgi:hypothetical protein